MLKKLASVFAARLSCVMEAPLRNSRAWLYEEVDNKGVVPGKTYRIYAQMEAEGDVVDAIFGDGEDYLEVKSTAPFFQHERGGTPPTSSSAQMSPPSKGWPTTVG